MTCGIATAECVVADSFVTYEPCFTGGKKVWAAKGCLWVGAGSSRRLSQFRLWTFGKAKKPIIEKVEAEDEETTKLEVLQVRPRDGIYLWINDAIPDFVDSPFFAVGSGGGYAMGALSKGATPLEALEIAAQWDSGTRGPFHALDFSTVKGRTRK